MPQDLCPHYGECGGCQSQDIPYPEQLAAKERFLQELFATHWQGPVPVTPSPVLWHYRNKIDPSFALMRYETKPPPDFVRETALGYKRTGKWFSPLDVETCLIAPEGSGELICAVRKWFRERGYRAFDERSGQGLLRNLVVRDTKRTGERMVMLLTAPGELDEKSFVEVVTRAFAPHSIYRGFSTRLAQVSFADELKLLAGQEQITEELRIPDGVGERTLRFRISPNSFFQTNPIATENMYSAIREIVRELRPRVLYDLYGGSGGIAFSCSDIVQHVFSVESVEAASIDGRANAQLNSITNVTFITEDVRHYCRHTRDGGGLAEGAAVILDPPRSGLHPKVISRLVQMRPRDIVYVSCNPKILAQELAPFRESYELTSLHGFDLFPHTKHVEVLATLRLKE